jgi:hypothetical protein
MVITRAQMKRRKEACHETPIFAMLPNGMWYRMFVVDIVDVLNTSPRQTFRVPAMFTAPAADVYIYRELSRQARSYFLPGNPFPFVTGEYRFCNTVIST